MTRDDVRAYYEGFGDREWTRLATAEGSVEFAVNTHAIVAYLPPSARVLDIGGGPGRYSLWLAERGHRVVLADLSPELLAIARDKVAASAAGALVEEIVEADACDLGRWPDGSFDAALSLGPFYHRPTPAERDRAAAELARVLRPAGLAFVALLPRYAFLRRTLVLPDERPRLAQPDVVARVLDDGVFINDLPGRFTGGYGVRPDEVAPFFARHGFSRLALLACEGLAAGLEDALAERAGSNPAAYQAILDVVVRTARAPSRPGAATRSRTVGDCTCGRRVRALSGSMGVRAAHARAPRGGTEVRQTGMLPCSHGSSTWASTVTGEYSDWDCCARRLGPAGRVYCWGTKRSGFYPCDGHSGASLARPPGHTCCTGHRP